MFVVLNLIIMDLDHELLNSCGNKEEIMAAAIATTSVILNVDVDVVGGRKGVQGKHKS